MHYYLDVIKQYAVFSGRMGRKAYWMFVLINIVIIVLISSVEGLIGTTGIIIGIYWLAILLPSIGAAIRRMHDTDKSGWWLLISFVPLVGGLIVLVLLLLSGTPGENNYGAALDEPGSNTNTPPDEPAAIPESQEQETIQEPEALQPAEQSTV